MVLLSVVLTLATLFSSTHGKMQKCNRRSNASLHREVITKNNTTSSKSSTTTSASRSSSTTAEKTASVAIELNGATGTTSTKWLEDKVRGVNLGSLFIIEPWMVPETWESFGCTGYTSERACNEALGLATLQSKYEHHWNTFYSQADFYEMKKRGLNTVRIPLPYWTVESTIGDDEQFARGSMQYVRQTVQWAKNAGLQVIMDLHALPGRQTTESFGGDTTTLLVSFFSDSNYNRAYEVLRNWTHLAHTDEAFSTVVAIEPVNEPKQGIQPGLLNVFYPQAQKVIRDTEKSLGVTCGGSGKKCLTIQYMSSSWGSGDPTTNINTDDNVAYDDHLYTQWIVNESQRSRQGYIDFLCTTDRMTAMNGPTIAGEWSLSTIGGGELDTWSDGALAFFQKFAAAQIHAGEKGAGWIFWSWKTELQSDTWDYQRAVKAGYIPSDLSRIDKTVCDGY